MARKIWLSAHVHAVRYRGDRAFTACGRSPSPTLRTSKKRHEVTCRNCCLNLGWEPSAEELFLRKIFGELH